MRIAFRISTARWTCASFFSSSSGEGVATGFVSVGWAAAAQPSEAKPAVLPSPEEELKKDIQVQRAVDILKAMRILEKARPAPAAPQAQAK